jgi:hypothetical protein
MQSAEAITKFETNLPSPEGSFGLDDKKKVAQVKTAEDKAAKDEIKVESSGSLEKEPMSVSCETKVDHKENKLQSRGLSHEENSKVESGEH